MDRFENDPEARKGDHEGLDEGCDGFELSVAERMVLVCRLFRLTDGQVIDTRHQDVEKRVDGGGKNGHRTGDEPRGQLESRQSRGGGDGIPGGRDFGVLIFHGSHPKTGRHVVLTRVEENAADERLPSHSLDENRLSPGCQSFGLQTLSHSRYPSPSMFQKSSIRFRKKSRSQHSFWISSASAADTMPVFLQNP